MNHEATGFEKTMAFELGLMVWHDVLGADRVCLQQALQGSALRPDAYVCLHLLVTREFVFFQCWFVVGAMPAGELHDGRPVGSLIDCDGRGDAVHGEICTLEGSLRGGFVPSSLLFL